MSGYELDVFGYNKCNKCSKQFPISPDGSCNAFTLHKCTLSTGKTDVYLSEEIRAKEDDKMLINNNTKIDRVTITAIVEKVLQALGKEWK